MKKNYVLDCLRSVFTFFIIYEFAMLFRLSPNEDVLSAFFPAPAFIVAMTFTKGLPAFPYIFFAATTASFTNYPPWELHEFNWLHITRQTIIYTVAGCALRKMLSSSTLQLANIETVWRFLVLSLLATASTGFFASALFYQFGFTALSELHHIFLSFMVGDLSGLLMFTPLAFAIERFFQQREALPSLRESTQRISPALAGNVLFAVAMSLTIFFLVIVEPAWSYFHYLVVIPIALVSVKHGVKAAIFAAFTVNLLSALLYQMMDVQRYSIIEIQMLYAVTALIAMLLGSYHDNQKIVSQKLRDNQMMLANLAQKSSLSELSSTIAHEVASPLQAALLNSQMSIQLLQSGQSVDRHLLLDLSQDVEFALNKAVQIHRRIYKNVTDSRTIQIERINMGDCFDDAKRLLQELISKHHVEFMNTELLSSIKVNADKLSMTQVFVNLIKNAVQAGATQITFGVSAGKTHTSIDIHNDGQEICKESRELIFQSLFSTKSEGMGLGLSICKTMLEGFGGHIELLSKLKQTPCSGETFRITLPAVEA